MAMLAIKIPSAELFANIRPGLWVAISPDQDRVICTAKTLEEVERKAKEQGEEASSAWCRRRASRRSISRLRRQQSTPHGWGLRASPICRRIVRWGFTSTCSNGVN